MRRACGLSRKAISKGIREIEEGSATVEGRVRRPGAGRKLITVSDPRLVDALEEMIDHQTRGDPESALRWICKSTRAIANELDRHKHPVSHAKVAQLLHGLNYSLQSNRKTEEGRDHPDRDAQFRHINAAVKRCLVQGSPVISVDTKKKELIGNYHNAGQQWLPAKQPRKVRGHDFPGCAQESEQPPDLMGILILRNSGYTRQSERQRLDESSGVAGLSSLPARNR